MSSTLSRVVGEPMTRIDGREKVTGQARYAYEHTPPGVAYGLIVTSTIARGEVRGIDAGAALALPGVHAVIWAGNAPRLDEAGASGELAVLQSPRVAYRGQIVAIVVADTLPGARHAESLLAVQYAPESHDVVLRADHPELYTPEKVNPNFPADSARGDFRAAFDGAAVTVEQTYLTPAEHNHPMEPHATVASWEAGRLTLHDSNQGSPMARTTIAKAFGLPASDVHVISQHVGGGFGSKGTPRPTVIAAALAAKVVQRPVKLAATRQQMFSLTGYRTPTIQRVAIGADAEGHITAISHEADEQSSTVQEFAEQTAVGTRRMYAAANVRTAHRLVRLDVPTPSWMRAPGEAPGSFALESALDELAVASGIDPVRLRTINEPERDEDNGLPWSSRNLIACLHEGAERFGWGDRDPVPAARRDGRWLHGTGVAASTYPARRAPSLATVIADPDGHFTVRIGAADIGTGARTVLTQIAADALQTAPDRVRMEIGDSEMGRAMLAGGSMGTTSWGTAVLGACAKLREVIADGVPETGARAEYDTGEEIERDAELSRHSYGAQFFEVRVDVDSGEVQVIRGLGVFAAGQIINPVTARSQLLGGMTMGIGMALHEESILDREFGDYVNHDFAGYHIPACADIEGLEATWIDERDDQINPLGAKGIGEIGITGTAAAIANAVFHATGVRIRELPIVPPRLIGRLPR